MRVGGIPKDGRYKLIHLSEEGEKLAVETQHFTSEVERQAKEGMTAEEFETLRRLLIKLVGVFEDGKE